MYTIHRIKLILIRLNYCAMSLYSNINPFLLFSKLNINFKLKWFRFVIYIECFNNQINLKQVWARTLKNFEIFVLIQIYSINLLQSKYLLFNLYKWLWKRFRLVLFYFRSFGLAESALPRAITRGCSEVLRASRVK